MKWTRADWLNLLLFAALTALFFWRILTPNAADRQSFPPGDFYAQFWAFTTFDVRELGAGRLPLWNPYAYGGSPFWADVQAAVFYPFSLLTLLLSALWGFSAFALELEAIAHFWLAATFMYLFSRQITGSRAAGVVSAVTWAFSGYLTGYPSQQLAVLQVDVWLPLILFFLHRAAPERLKDEGERRKNSALSPQPSSLLFAGAALGLALLAGHPQSYLIVGYVSVAWLLFLWLPGNIEAGEQGAGRRGENSSLVTRHSSLVTRHSQPFTFYVLRFTRYALRAIPPLLTFLLTGVALAAIQFIPAVEYTRLSVRAEGVYERMSGGLPLTDLIQILLPGQVSHYSPLYVGVVGLVLALAAVWLRPNRHTIFWGAVAALSLLIAFGGNTFLYSPLYLVAPGFSIFRGQERWAMAFAFSLSVLAGYGFSRVAEAQGEKSVTRHSSLVTRNSPFTIHHSPFTIRLTRSLFLFAILLTVAFFFGLNNTGWSADSPFYGLLAASSLLAVLALLMWLLWIFAPYLPRNVFAALTVALVCLDLFSVNWQTNLYPQPPEWHTQTPAAVQAIQADAAGADEPFRVYNEFRLYDNYGVPFALEDLWGASPLRPSRYDQFLAPPMPIERTWELLNVKYVITWREQLYLPSTIIHQEPAADGTTYVHRLDAVGPRAWLVGRVEVADDAAILQKIADPAFDRWNIALLEENNQIANLQIANSNSQFAIHNSQFPTPGRIIHQISADAPALLVLSETHYPGWQATVDGQPAPILRADYVLRAVPVPAGDHTVELTFRPRSVTLGAIISGLALVFVAGAAGLAARRKR